MSEPIVVGIDGGGSKTLVAVADRHGNVVDLARGPAIGPENANWRVVLDDQARAFADRSGLAGAAAAMPAFGEVDAVSSAQERAIGALFGAVPHRVLNDVDAAHIGAFAGGSGILILAGTGSMTWARDAAGASHRNGGWGEIVGDEGSGYWIGKQVLSVMSKAIDGRAAPTRLVAEVFAALGLDLADKVNQLVGWASQLSEPRTQIASLARIALDLAQQGDPAARSIVDAASLELAAHVRAMEQRLQAPTLAWSFAGGLFSNLLFRQAVAERIGRAPLLPQLPPVGGAVLAAAQQIDWPIDAAFMARLANSLATSPQARVA